MDLAANNFWLIHGRVKGNFRGHTINHPSEKRRCVFTRPDSAESIERLESGKR